MAKVFASMKRPYVQLVKYLSTVQRWLRQHLTWSATSTATSTEEILTHDPIQQADTPPGRIAPAKHSRTRYPAQIGLVGLVVIVTWWSWPGLKARNPLALFNVYFNHNSDRQRSLAIINPANLVLANQQPTSTAGDSPLLSSPTPDKGPSFPVIIVTPTAASRIQVGPDQSPDNQPDPAKANTISLQPQVIIVTGNRSEPAAHPAGADTDVVAQAPISTTNPVVIEIDIPANSPAEPVNIIPAAVERQRTNAGNPLQPQVVLVPTATATALPPPEPDVIIPSVEIVPAVGVKFTPTPELPAPAPTATDTPTPIVAITGPGRIWSSFTPLPAPESDHFWIGSLFPPSVANHSASPNYQFGSTGGGRYRPHHGIDISNPLGTPVQAGVEGTVVHAGSDQDVHLGPYGNFYGRAVVIRLDRRLSVAGGNMGVFVLYGHLSEVRVVEGQHVEPADIVGLVGMTGIAIGPHLHVEVRLGANSYAHTVNPWLWMKPEPGFGVVAVRLLTADGRTWAGAKISIARFVNGSAVWGRQIETYLDTERIGPDPSWGENGAMGDVPAGYYYLVGNIEGESIRAEFEVADGETTYVEIRTTR